MSIAITGASGQIGRRAAELVLEQDDTAELILLTRSPEKLADLAARGAEVRSADFESPEELKNALTGVEKLLLISTDSFDGRAELQAGVVTVAKDAGVKHVAYTSIPKPDGNPAFAGPSHYETEQAIKASGLDWTFLRNNLYTDMQLPSVEQAIASGQWVTNVGDGRVAYVTREDCAAAAAAVLVQDGHAGKIYDITGPIAYTASDLAALASELGGKPVEVVNLDDEAYAAGLVEHAGLPEFVGAMLASFGKAIREGYLEEVSDSVESLTGRAPTGLADLAAPLAA
jgi:NAD(P)H dehydrogenase (quinone)